MALHELSFIELHNQFFMQGSNLGTKINAAQRGAKLFYNDETQLVYVYFKNKVSGVPMSNVASFDLITLPDEIESLLEEARKSEPVLPPAIARARRTPDLEATITELVDPNDPDQQRALARARSMTANRAEPMVLKDDLIQQARAAAMGVKHHQTAQVGHPNEPETMTAVRGKRKAISHAGMQAQVAAEMKEP